MDSKFTKILKLIQARELNLAEQECLNLISADNRNYEYFNIYAIVCFQLEKYDDAIKNWKKSTDINSKYYFGFNNIGKAYLNLKKFNYALENFNKTLEIKPNFFEAYNNKGNVLTKMGRNEEALKNYNTAIEINPKNIHSYIFKAHLLSQLNKLDEALKNYQIAYSINPEFPLLLGYILNIKSQICDWDDLDVDLKKLKLNIENNKKTSFPFTTLVLLDSPELQKKASEIWSKGYELTVDKPHTFKKVKSSEKIKLGYFTADFRDHATSHLTSEMFENHDRSKFEIYGFYLGSKVNDNDKWHQRLKKNFKNFYFVKEMSDLEISKLVMSLNIDIAIDLMTHCTNGMENRFGVFVRRCAPIQINFLGYPGTSGSKEIDYIIADKVVIPAENKKYYSEKIIYLPDSYQPNSQKKPFTNKKFLRKDFNLPEDKFIFCCFNQHQRISPVIFNIWTNILKNNSHSVLWLLEDNIFSKKNLIKEAEKKGVDKNRIIFSQRISIEDHLERIKLADLFLDTYPYSAHTTCSDALRAGLPVLTIKGNTFASRVASSLLTVINLPELITENFESYENLANELIRKKNYFKEIRNKLKKNVTNSLLFNSKIYTKNIEQAFQTVVGKF